MDCYTRRSLKLQTEDYGFLKIPVKPSLLQGQYGSQLLTAPYVFTLRTCRDSQNRSSVFQQPRFSSRFGQSISSYNQCVGSMVAVVRWPDLGNRTPTGDPERAHLLYYCCASATIIMALPAWSLISLSTSVHSSMLACVKLRQPDFILPSSPNVMTLQLPDWPERRKPTQTMKT